MTMFELQAKVKARDLRGKKKDELMKQANELKQVWNVALDLGMLLSTQDLSHGIDK